MASTNPPHRHHYIPRMILRNFVNPEGGLCFWRREFPIGAVKTTKPENLFVEDNLYTFVNADGGRDVSLEHGFARMENYGGTILANLISVVRANRTPRLRDEAWEFFYLFHYFSNKRSAAWHSRFVTREDIIAVAKEIAAKPRWTDEERARIDDEHDLEREMKNALIAAKGTPPPADLLALIHSKGMAIYVAPFGASFVIGDHPTAIAAVGSAYPGAKSGRLSFMPIAPDIAIGYHPQAHSVHVQNMTKAQIRTMNEAMTRQSMMIAGRSNRLVGSLSRVPYRTPEYFAEIDYLSV